MQQRRGRRTAAVRDLGDRVAGCLNLMRLGPRRGQVVSGVGGRRPEASCAEAEMASRVGVAPDAVEVDLSATHFTSKSFFLWLPLPSLPAVAPLFSPGLLHTKANLMTNPRVR